MSVEKDPLRIEEEEEEDEEREMFACKYCDFETVDVDQLDEHIVIHEEAFLEDELVSDDETDVSFNHSNEPPVKYSIVSSPKATIWNNLLVTLFCNLETN